MVGAPPQKTPLAFAMMKKNVVGNGGYSIPTQRQFPKENLPRWRQTINSSNFTTNGHVFHAPIKPNSFFPLDWK